MNRMIFSCPETDLLISLHNHSTFSDGSGAPEEMCRRAKKLGFRVFGLSEHWIIPPGDDTDARSCRIDPARLDEYVDTMLKLRKELADGRFSLQIGLEMDFYFETFEQELKRLEAYPLDYLIGSVHYAEDFPIDRSEEDWNVLDEEKIHEICTVYFRKLTGAAKSGAFSFLGHLDLPKKFNKVNPADWMAEMLSVLDAAAGSNTALELNTAGWYKPCNAPYPEPAVLREARKRRIPVIAGSDAHALNQLSRGFDRAGALLQEAGYSVLNA